MEQEHDFWDSENRVAVCYLPEEEIDDRLANEKPDHPDSIQFRKEQKERERSSSAADWLCRFLDVVLPSDITTFSDGYIGKQVLSLAWMIQYQHKDIAGKSQADIARTLGVTRALICHYVRRLEDGLGGRLHARGQKTISAPAIFSAVQKKAWEKRHRKQAQVRIWARNRLANAPEELADALCNQPREMVCKIIAEWGASVVEEMRHINTGKNYYESKEKVKIASWPRPEAPAQPEEIQAIGGA